MSLPWLSFGGIDSCGRLVYIRLVYDVKLLMSLGLLPEQANSEARVELPPCTPIKIMPSTMTSPVLLARYSLPVISDSSALRDQWAFHGCALGTWVVVDGIFTASA